MLPYLQDQNSLNDSRALAQRRVPLGESPWYWLALFCALGLAALWAASQKFGVRQAQLERQYQARVWAGQLADPASPTPEECLETTYYSTPENLRMGLTPLRVLLWGMLCVSLVLLTVQRGLTQRLTGFTQEPPRKFA